MLTTRPRPGGLDWISLAAPDVVAVAEFYHRLFSWDLELSRPDAGGRGDGCFRLDGRKVAGIRGLWPHERPAWTVHFRVEDMAGALAAAREAGGAGTVRPPEHAPALSGEAELSDPTGACCGLREPVGQSGLEAVNEPGTLVSTELHSTDAYASAAFYQAVLGWQVVPGARYRRLTVSPSGCGPEAAHGGITQLSRLDVANGAGSRWYPQLSVTDCDAALNTAITLGGSVTLPPTELPEGGRLAMLADPAGAVCAIVAGEH